MSGSGKSSLAFDTIYAEGQRRYVESLSAYARQFLGQMDKPDVDFIEGLSPAISIDQKSASRNPRSTVGTITEIYDYLRLLYARIGVQHDPETGEVLVHQTPQEFVDQVLDLAEGTRFQVLAPVVRGRKGDYHTMLAELSHEGFSRARIDGEIVELTGLSGTGGVSGEGLRLARYEQHTIEVVVDRLVRRAGIERRLTDSVETALRLAEGVCVVEVVDKSGKAQGEPLELSRGGEALEPRNFSFNSPYGACATCDGLGYRFQVDAELVVPDDNLSLAEGAISPWSGFRSRYFDRVLEAVATEFGFSVDTPWKRLGKRARPPCSTAPATATCTWSTGTGTGAAARITRPSRVWSRGSSADTASPRATERVSSSRATCARCRARRAKARASSRHRSPSPSATRASTTSARSRCGERPSSSSRSI